jgi:hypothetical protein
MAEIQKIKYRLFVRYQFGTADMEFDSPEKRDEFYSELMLNPDVLVIHYYDEDEDTMA